MSTAQDFMNECTALEIEILKLKAEKAELLVTLQIVRGKHGCGALVLPPADLERVDLVINKAEGAPA